MNCYGASLQNTAVTLYEHVIIGSRSKDSETETKRSSTDADKLARRC